jgi:hypothetical protein
MTFAEVIFSIAIVAFVLLSIIGTLTGGLEAIQKGSSYSQASIIAQRTLEKLKTSNYTSIPSGTTETFTEENFTGKVIYSNEGTYTGGGNYKKITVNVSNVTSQKDSRKKAEVIMEIIIIPTF